MRIQIHIERLVLDGLPVERRHAPLVQQAVEAELARLLTTEGVGEGLKFGGAVDRLAGGVIEVGQRAEPARLGEQIARAVYGSIGS